MKKWRVVRPSKSMEPLPQIVIGPDGTVIAATGPLPPGLVDVRLDDCDALPREVREAGNALMTPTWRLVLSRDGTVLGATEDAPASLVGTRLDDRDDVPEDLKQAGRAVLERARHSPPIAASVLLQSTQQAVLLTVIDALPLRRKPADLRTVLRSTWRRCSSRPRRPMSR